MLIIISSMVLSVKPAPQTGVLGLIIIYPKNSFYHNDGNLTFHYHIFNATNDLQINVSVGLSCYIHVYNGSNKHLIEDKLVLDSNGMELKYALPYNITNKTGEYPYLVWCNTTNGQGGFISDSFEITNDGKEKEGGYLLALFIGILPLLIGFLLLKWSDILGDEHNIIRLALMLMSFTTIFISLWLTTAGVVRFVSWPEMEESLGTITLIFGGLYFAVLSYFIIYLLRKVFIGIQKSKEERLEL